MKEVVDTFKNFNASNWINLLLASLLWFAYTSNEKRIDRLEQIVVKEQNVNKILFKLYNDCITKKNK